ncbi:IucA/IucC family protein [Actinopolyspora mortivallis]|uniref:IucA/IucC family siderophore biosynthesis protein n=1 Tax=Actinopolyspora mortivallis TaxID=33906 RepID=A0A2T0GYM9_ACTMO|nr:IucA/IucC family protein [Actinopolyspora mortivallis]PRW64190.1 IucA/IucC family siderophore biosynthesis protein [Actinopolyspora mortivallis]
MTGVSGDGDHAAPNEHEVAVGRRLEEHEPELARRWWSALPRARADTCRAFLEALLGERTPVVRGRRRSVRWPPRRFDVESPVELAAYFGDRVGTVELVRLSGGSLGALWQGGPGTGRMSEPVLVTEDGVLPVRRPDGLVRLLRDSDTTARWDAVGVELVDSACNLALSRVLVERGRRRCPPQEWDGIDPLSVFGPAENTAVELDALTAEGHGLHPCGKVRLGFEPEDCLNYAPEGGRRVALAFVAVRGELLASTADHGGRSVGELVGEHFPRVHGLAVRELRERGEDPGAYALVPVHPWQLRVAVPRHYREEVESGGLVPLERPRLPCRPTLSLRTLVTVLPGRHGRRLTVKTSLDVLLTSTRRTMSAGTTRDGPATSVLLRELLAREPVAAGRVDTVADLAGVAFAASGAEEGSPRGRGLSALLREDPADRLGEGDRLVPVSALRACSPVSGRVLAADLVDHLATCDRVSGAEAARRFLRGYGELLFAATLPLLSRHGVALEAHMQNTLLVLRDGRPARLLLRDFAGMRVYRGRMSPAVREGFARRARVTVAEGVRQLHEKLFHSVVWANLAEVVRLLGDSHALAVGRSWRIVRAAAVDTVERFSADCAEPARCDLAALLGPSLPQKALVTMRLYATGGDVYRPRPNPLHHLGA